MSQKAPINRLLFYAASQFQDAEERRAFLEFACRDDETRMKRIEVLLEAERDAAQFFDMPTGQSLLSDARADEDDSDGLGAWIGGYQLIDRLGSGGCGVVYLAKQVQPEARKVALKIIRLGMDTRSVMARFAMERESLAMMDHPHIARVLDAGSTTSGKPFFVMELVDGEKITDYCNRRKCKLRQRLELFMLVCQAVQHAHQKGIIHRDLKPSNILVCEINGQAVPKVIDFGIAKATAAGLQAEGTQTLEDSFMGTPAYMSPEQALGSADIDTRSDVYSLGALLCELLIGSPPFAVERFQKMGVMEMRQVLCREEPGLPSARLRGSSREMFSQIAAERGTDAAHLLPTIVGDLDWIVMKATDKERTRRYETANGLAADVRRHLQEEPVTARPPSRRYLLKKLVRRNKVAFSAGILAALGLFCGFGLSTWWYFQEKQARKEAEIARANEVILREKAKAADMMTQAAVFVRYGDLEKADQIVLRVPDEQMALSLEAVDTLRALADWHLAAENWKEAADRLSKMVPAITSVDLTDTDRSSSLLLPAAAAIVQWGTPEQYQRLREMAIKRFSDTSNHAVVAQFGKAVLLTPAEPQNLSEFEKMIPLLEQQLNSGELNNRSYLLAWRQFSAALIHYRLGHVQQSAKWSDMSMQTQDQIPLLVASNQILQAMIAVSEGNIDAAQALIESPRKTTEVWRKNPLLNDGPLEQWFDRVNALILLREAEELLAKAEAK